MVRRFFLFLFSGGLIVAGICLVFASLQKPNWYSIILGAVMGGFLIFFGSHLLWTDIIKPRLGKRGDNLHRTRPIVLVKKAALPLIIIWNISTHLTYRYHMLKYPEKRRKR